MVSNASDDLPEPDSPVITTSWSRGISRSTFLRLCSRAPRITIRSLAMAVYYKARLERARPQTARALPRVIRAAIHASGAAVSAGYAPATLAHAGSRKRARHAKAAAPTREPASLATGSSAASRGATTADAITPSPVRRAHDGSAGHMLATAARTTRPIMTRSISSPRDWTPHAAARTPRSAGTV